MLDFDSVLNQFYEAINESKMEFEEGEQMMMMMMMMMMMIVNIEFGNTFYVAILQIVSLRTSQKCC